MATANLNRRYGHIYQGHTVPYGTFAGVDGEVKMAYYNYGVRNDEDWPELPVWEPEPVEIDPFEVVHQQDLMRVVGEMLDTLRPREAKVLRLRYGIGISADCTFEEVGMAYDLTRERIRQIEVKAIRRLKTLPRSEALRLLIEDESRWGPGKLNKPK